jgi:ribonuclease P protein component
MSFALRSHQFREVYSRGRRLKGPHLTILFIPNGLPCVRLGLSTSKKRFKLSVRRHYIQRRLREVYRRNKMCFLPGYDIVISAHSFDRGKTRFEDINNELLSLAQKAKLLKK